MKQQRLISPGSLDRMLQAAREAWQKRDYQQSLERYERLSRLAPANYGLLLELGCAYGKRYLYSDAERCFEKAARVAPKGSDILAKAGGRCQEFGGFEMARRYLERARAEKNASPEAMMKLADVYDRLRLNEEALNLVNETLQKNSAYAPALLKKAKLEIQAGRLDEAEQLLRALLAKTDPALRVWVWYELGSVLDRLGRYDEAMKAFLEAKALLLPQAGPHLAALRIVRTHIKELPLNASKEVLQRWFEPGTALQPTRRLALLCGHPRSGTTLLEQVLDSHPDIVSVEETTIFHDDAYFPLSRGFAPDAPMFSILEAAQPTALQQSRANYFRTVEQCLGHAINGRLLIDKNPSLTFLIPALIRLFPEVKFLVALRDPRDVVLSCFMQSLPLSQVSSAYLTLADTITEYASLMDVWRMVAPRMRNAFVEVRYEDMVGNLEAEARRVLGFLDVPWDARVLHFDEHARQKTVRSPTYADVTKPVFKRAVGRWRNYQKYLEPHLAKLEPFVKAFGYD